MGMLNQISWMCTVCGADNVASPDYCASCGTERIIITPLSKPVLNGTPFLVNPQHRDFVEGLTRRLPMGGCACSGIFSLVFMIIPLLMMIFGGGLFYNQIQKAQELADTGVKTTARVTDKRLYTDSEDGDSYYLSYEYFTRNDQRIQTESSVRQNTYNTVQIGENIQVRYVPDNPTNVDVVGEEDNPRSLLWFALCWVAFSGMFVCIGVAGLYGAARHYDRTRTLEKHGSLISGELTGCAGREDSDNDYMLTVHYQFVSPHSGKLIRHKLTEKRNDLKGKALPIAGTPLQILYVSDWVYRVM